MSTPVFMTRGQLRLEEMREAEENPDTEKLAKRKALADEMDQKLRAALDGTGPWEGWMGPNPHKPARWWIK